MVTRPDVPIAPPLARALIRLLTPGEDRSFLIADLEEEFQDLAAAAGVAAARRWYWKQVCLSAIPLLHRRGSTLLSSQLNSVALTRRGGTRLMAQNFFTDVRYAWRMSRR